MLSPIVCFLTIIVIFFSLVALHTAAKKPDRQFNCIFFRSRISERNSIPFCCLRDSKLGSRQINHFLAKNKKVQLLESFLPNSIVYLILKSLSVSQKSSYCKQPPRTRGTYILGEVRNLEISRVTHQLLCSKSHDFLAVFALAHSKINQIA